MADSGGPTVGQTLNTRTYGNVFLNQEVDLSKAVSYVKKKGSAGKPRRFGLPSAASSLKTSSPTASRHENPPRELPRELLDGFTLIGSCGVELPEDVETVVLTSQHLTDVEEEDLHHFVSLAVLDVGDNRLPGMHVLSKLPNVRELKMQCNELRTLSVQPDTFLHLETLDLSYNHLDFGALLALAPLPRLRDLDLSCNNIAKIPKGALTEGSFPRLQTLHLGAQTPKLAASALPKLGVLRSLRALRIPANQLRRVDIEKLSPDYFPYLGLLDLSSNLIEMEDDITALAILPVLEKVILWGNPLARLAPRDIGAEVPLTGSQTALLVLRKPDAPTKPPLRHLYNRPLPALIDGPPDPTKVPIMPFQEVEETTGAFDRITERAGKQAAAGMFQDARSSFAGPAALDDGFDDDDVGPTPMVFRVLSCMTAREVVVTSEAGDDDQFKT
ncbi:hypothetical protein CYMTET_25848, partial [Cymbomonas tetramitiformis]